MKVFIIILIKIIFEKIRLIKDSLYDKTFYQTYSFKEGVHVEINFREGIIASDEIVRLTNE